MEAEVEVMIKHHWDGSGLMTTWMYHISHHPEDEGIYP